MNGVRLLSPAHLRSPMWFMLKIFICNLLWLAEYQCKGVVQGKILVLINFFSVNVISIEIALGRGRGRGEGGAKLRNLEGTYFSSASHSTQTE